MARGLQPGRQASGRLRHNKGIRIWDVAGRGTQATWPSDSKGHARGLAFSPDGNRLATGGSLEGLVELWDTATGQKVQVFKGHFGTVYLLAFSPDSMRLASGAPTGPRRVWDAASRQDTVCVPQGRAIILGRAGAQPHRPDALDGSRIGRAKRASGSGTPRRASRGCGPIELPQAVVSQAWTSDGRHLYVADVGKTMRVVDVATGEVVRTFPIDAEISHYSIALSADERWCAPPRARWQRSRCGRLGPVASSGTIRDLDGYPVVLAFSPDGRALLGADRVGAGKIWDIAAGPSEGRGDDVDRRRGPCRPVQRVDGQLLAVAGSIPPLATGEVRILDAETARRGLVAQEGHAITVLDVAFSPDGHRLATGLVWGQDGPTLGPDRGARDPETGRLRRCRSRSVWSRRPPPDRRHA